MTEDKVIPHPNPLGIGMPIPKKKNTPDGESDYCGKWHGRYIAHGAVQAIPFDSDDIAEVIATWESDTGWERNVAAVVQLNNKCFVSWETFSRTSGNGFYCDYYGGGADVHFAATLDDIIRWGLTDEGRRNLNLSLPNGNQIEES